MKTIKFIVLSCLSALIFSCSDNDEGKRTAIFAVPVIKKKAELRNAVNVQIPLATNHDGKIYVTQNHLFYIDQENGVHIFDNSSPASPTNVSFLNISGVHDIAIKGNYLYADNFMDLLVFDISNVNAISLVHTVEDSIEFYPDFPEEAEFFDYTMYPEDDEIVVGYTLETRNRPRGNELIFANDATSVFESGAANSAVGTGGSFARFQINNNALYTVDKYKLNVFNITNPLTTSYQSSVYMDTWIGGQLETLFKQKEFLFVGSTTGMHIINAENEFNPVYISSFSHATACDPVVVFGNTAYITIRGGNTCGAIEDQINVINITNPANPTLLSTYLAPQPKGLAIKNEVLYVCTSEGLKVFNASNSNALTLQNTLTSNATDVIALDNALITVGPNVIRQYSYGLNHSLNLISTVNF